MFRVGFSRWPIALVGGMLVLTVAAAPVAASDLDRPTGTGAESGPGTASGITKLVDFRVGKHATYDRVVFVFSNGVPEFRVRYDTVEELGTGRPVDLLGDVSLDVVMQSTRARGTTGQSLAPGLPAVAEVKVVGSFEAVAVAGIGVDSDSPVGFRVLTLSDPGRLVIDVAHPSAVDAPEGAVATGGGGTADGGPNAGLIGAGSALVVAAAASLVFSRRLRREN